VGERGLVFKLYFFLRVVRSRADEAMSPQKARRE